jgi:hypothetical protein
MGKGQGLAEKGKASAPWRVNDVVHMVPLRC